MTTLGRGRQIRCGWQHGLALCLMLISAISLVAPPTPAWAQASGMFGTGDSDAVIIKATVKAVDQKNRTVTLVSPGGETKTIKVGPDVQNLPQVKPGDVVIARYTESDAYVVAPAGTKSPDDMMALAAAQAAPGQLPAGGVAGMTIATGLVVGVNPAAHTVSVVNPDGGEVRTFTVKNPDYQSMLPSVKVGDTITAVVSEAVVLAVEPAK